MKVLVLLASYNGEKYIIDQITSILKQKDVEIEIVISDDSSHDDTISVVRSYFPNITIHEKKVGSGSAAKNFLGFIKNFEYQDFDYFALSDQDDIWKENKLKRAILKLEEKKADLYASNLTIWKESNGSQSLLKKDFIQKKFDYLFEGGSAGCTYVITKEMYQLLKEEINLIPDFYYNSKVFSHDWFIYFVARKLNKKVFIDSESHILYRIHQNNVHGILNSGSWFAIKERIKLIREGWYTEHIVGLSSLLDDNSIEKKIYKLYCKGFLHRLYILIRYNFQLMRDKKKFLQFFILSIFFVKSIGEIK